MFGGFDDIFNHMNRMNNMMNSMMSSPFGGINPGFGLMNMNPLNQMNNQMQLTQSHMNDPFNLMRNSLMQVGTFPGQSSSISISSMPGQSVSYSSSVMTVSNDGSGRPQIYEKTSSQICGPNGVRQTKETVRDSKTGLQQIKIGRHINDRGHLKAKKRNVYNGEESEEEELINLDEEEVESFTNEFDQKTKDFRQKYQSIQSHPNHGRQRLALTNGPSSSQQQQLMNNSQPRVSQQIHNLQREDTRPPSRGKKVKDLADKKSKKKSKKPY